MPNIKSAIKRVKVTATKNARNVPFKSALRTAIRKFGEAVASGNFEEARTLLVRATSMLDKGVSKGIIHKNAAARRKSRLARMLNHAVVNNA